ncbi:hypothetical protein KXV85_005083, partial [Aspergillus fumigatus]
IRSGGVARSFPARPLPITSAAGALSWRRFRARSDGMSGSPHLVHGMGTELEAPVWPAITADEAGAVLVHFPQAGGLIGLHWHSPRPFSAATLVEAAGGRFILKRHHHRLRSPDALAQEHGFIAHLRAAGVHVPEVMEARGGTAIAQGEWTYELHRLSPGLDLYRDRPS